ncbi:hypothetical protein EYF80_024691 [Liparis tanakae]|uniref:Uncharacterized protein n=1 Tax=Liparis tanakae TaxID=230148 RepID=A0A4Z2HJP1_9TELE|nr:hypothetical protein EYF80_024691 [Liparis tanakae]
MAPEPANPADLGPGGGEAARLLTGTRTNTNHADAVSPLTGEKRARRGRKQQVKGHRSLGIDF